MTFDTERVIIEVQCHPIIWDQANDLYKDRDARTAAWLEIGKELFENFDNFSNAEKKTTVSKVQSRWKTARDTRTYMKVKASKKKIKSGSGAKAGKKYIFYDMLTFLDSNSSHEADESIDNPSAEQDSLTNDNITIASTSVQNSNHEETDTESSNTSRKRKRAPSPTAFEKELLQCVKQNNVANNDEDLNFFKSLIPTVQKFSTFKKLSFRTKVLEAMIDIEKETVITLDDLPSLNIPETQNTSSMIDLASLIIRSETQNTDTIED